MHHWGDEGVDWDGINNAAAYIGENLIRWGRVGIMQYKEKFGTVRVYCQFGWHDLHSITHPGHAWIRYQRNGVLWRFNYFTGHGRIFQILNLVVVPYHRWLYRFLYRQAIRKWPHLRDEILGGADYSELLEGL